MAVLPTFEPQGTPTETLGAFDSGQSWVARRQQMEIQKQQAARQQDEYDIMRPVNQMKAVADVATAQSAVNNMKRMQEMRIKAASVAGPANDEFQDALQLADFNSKADALAGIQAKYAWMETVPGYKPFVDAIKNARAEAHVSAVADMRLEEQLAATKAQQDARIEAATIAAEGRGNVANTRADAAVQVAETNAKARTESAATTADGRYKAAQLKMDRNYELERTMEKRDEALAKGNQEDAQIYQDHLNKMNATSSSTPDRALPATPPAPKVAPVTPSPAIKLPSAKIPPKVTIDGQDYPVFKDKDNNLAYLKDGKYIPIDKPTE